jgi:hypothetical protein
MTSTARNLVAVLAAGIALVGLRPDAQAQCAAGQTEVTLTVTEGGFPAEQSWELLDDNTGGVLASDDCGGTSAASVTLCLNDGQNYTFNAFDDWGDGWNGGSWTITNTVTGAVIGSGIANNGAAGDNTDVCDASQLEESFTFDPGAGIAGCTDSTAINFNPAATIDDGSCVFPAANDACADAIDIPLGTCYTGSNTGATFGGDTLDAACVDGDLTPNDIWFTTTVGATGSITFQLTQTPGFSSIIELYLGTCGSLGGGILASIGACNNYGSGGGITLSGLPAGATLYIRYWDFGSDQEGALELCLSEPAAGCTDPCATNFDSTASIDDGSCILPATDADDCSAAAAVAAGTTSFFSGGATGSDITSCTTSDSASIWFAYTVPAGLDTVNLYTCGSSFDTGLSLWDACGGSEIACNDDGTPGVAFGSTCGGSNFQSYVALTDSLLDALAGSTIYIRIAGFNGSTGCGDLIIEEIEEAAFVCETPQNPTTSVSGTTATLSWDATPDADGYRITGGPIGGGLRTVASATNSKVLGGGILDAATCYQWRVRARCSDGSKSGYSDLATFCTDSAGARQAAEVAVEVYPNPANDRAVLNFHNERDEQLLVQVYDVSGQLVLSRSFAAAQGQNRLDLETAGLSVGSYIVQLQGGTTVRAVNLEVAR